MNKKHSDYEKIDTLIYYPCFGLALRHIVKLGSPSQNDKKKIYFHSEVTYTSNMYSNKDKLTNIKLNMFSYLSLVTTGRDWSNRDDVMISYKQMPLLRRGLENVLMWFYDDKFKDLYKKIGGQLRINTAKYNSLLEEIHHLNGKSIFIKPSIIIRDDIEYEGVAFYINSFDNDFYMTLDEIEAFHDIIDRFDLFSAAQNAINYLQRPINTDEYDYNMSSYGASEPNDYNIPISTGMNGRTVTKKKKSYFDNINEL